MQENVLEKHWQEIYDALPPLASRVQIQQATGGLISARTLANRDARGTGIPGKTTMFNKVCYPRENVIPWMKANVKYQ